MMAKPCQGLVDSLDASWEKIEQLQAEIERLRAVYENRGARIEELCEICEQKDTEIRRLRAVVRKWRDDLKWSGVPQGTEDDPKKLKAWKDDYQAETDRLCGEAAEEGGE